jgi:hypothetical protein
MYNTRLEARIDAAAGRWQKVEKKKMFGGLCYLLRGNMAFGIYKDLLIIRMNKEQGAQSLKDRNVKPFDITGRPMAGWVMVKEAGWKGRAGLDRWLGIGKHFARSLPEKKGKGKANKTKTLREYKQC